MCIREGKDPACGCLCPAKVELKFFFPEYDQKKKKSDGDGVCRCVGRGSGSQLGEKSRAGCNQMQPEKSSLCSSVT